MPEFSARPKQMDREAEELLQDRTRLDEAARTVEQITAALRELSCLEDQKVCLKKCSRKLGQQAVSAAKLGQALRDIANLYQQTEQHSRNAAGQSPGTAVQIPDSITVSQDGIWAELMPVWQAQWRMYDLLRMTLAPCQMISSSVIAQLRR